MKVTKRRIVAGLRVTYLSYEVREMEGKEHPAIYALV